MKAAHDAVRNLSPRRPHSFFILISLIAFAASPVFCSASVSITEILYDPAGSDDGHEWVEVYNSGAPFDLSKWKLFEGGSNHGLTAYAGGSTLPTGGYAVIADNPQKFLADWPLFSGILFDTALSGGLNNTNGETLVLRSDAGVDVDTVTYSPSWGGNGDGNSLQKVGASFTAASPTPGSALAADGGTSNTSGTDDDEESSETGATTTTPSGTSASAHPVEPRITVSAGGDRVVVAGADTVFKGVVRGLTGEVISNARLLWNFGNGDSREGPSVLYAFPFPGKYAVVLDASSETFSAAARFTVTVVPAKVSISNVTADFVEITNSSDVELNIGLWQLAANGTVFRFPANTILFPREAVLIANSVTGLKPLAPESVTLLYPNGTLAAVYGTKLIAARTPAGAEASYVAGNVLATSVSQKEGVSQDNQAQNLLAAPISAFNPVSMQSLSSFGMLPWILGLFVVIGIGIAAALLIRKDRGSTTGYTIIEEE